MTALSKYETWYGRAEPPPAAIPLRAGGLTLVYQAGDLRTICLGSQELIRRVYMAVRDVNWNTIPGQLSDLEINAGDDHFHIRYQAVHEAGPLRFRWTATITGDREGRISYLMDGLTESAFRYCRIGFCVLHPILGIAGSDYEAQTPDGPVAGTMPQLVAPQIIEDGFEIPLFPPCSQLVVETPAGIRIRTDFEGDLFETEDQRNWTDESFKTYCTPLSLGYPHQAEAGMTIRQEVIISAKAKQPELLAEPVPDNRPLSLSLATTASGVLPLLGFGLAAESPGLSTRETELLSALRPAHLKVELHLRDRQWPAALQNAIRTGEQVGSALELVIFLTDAADDALAILRSRLHGVSVARIIVFHEAEAAVTTTSTQWIQFVRERLADGLPSVPIVGGTNGNFAELNRQRPDISVMDGVAYSINPQVHASDEQSLIEAIDSQRDTLVTARSFCEALPISVSSITLKPPFNQAATEEEAAPDPNQLPANVDGRQMALFAATWTVGSLRAMVEGSADSVTYYETSGWRGLFETEAGSPLPALFRSAPGMIFPVYWVFRFLADAERALIRPLLGDRSLRIEGFGLRSASQFSLLLANLLPSAQEIVLNAMPSGAAQLWRLNEETMVTAASDPRAFLTRAMSRSVFSATWDVTLLPYETLFLQILPS